LDTNTQICQIQSAYCIYIPPDITLPPRDGDSKATMTAIVICWLLNSGSARPHSKTLLIVKVMVINQFDRSYKDKHPKTRPGILHITFGFGVDVRF
jgi:hypothetical protein